MGSCCYRGFKGSLWSDYQYGSLRSCKNVFNCGERRERKAKYKALYLRILWPGILVGRIFFHQLLYSFPCNLRKGNINGFPIVEPFLNLPQVAFFDLFQDRHVHFL